jgi:hypothetical protein
MKKTEKERKTYQYSIIKEYDDYETAEQEIQNLEIKGFKMSYKRFQSNSHHIQDFDEFDTFYEFINKIRVVK